MVFSCDVDRSGDALGDLRTEPEFWGASGCHTSALGDQASRKHSGARMHMPAEFRHADPASDCSIGEKGQLHAFGFDQDQAEHVERAHRAPAFQGCAGSTSGKVNEETTHQCYGRIQNQARARVYNVQAAPTSAPVILLSAGHLEDSELGANVLSREKVAQFSMGVAGQSSIDQNVASEAYDRGERGRAIVPRRETKTQNFINPSSQSFTYVKEREQKNEAVFSRQLYTGNKHNQPAGLPANETNENAYREMVHLDGDSRQAKRIEIAGSPATYEAHASTEGPPRLGAQMTMLGQDPDARRPDYRVSAARVSRALDGAGGKSTGMNQRNHNDSSDLGMAIRGDEADRAYARALGAGREMLATPYSPAHNLRSSPAQRSSLSGNGGALAPAALAVPAYGVQTDTAGNFEKEGMKRKPSAAQASAQASPFAVDGGKFDGGATRQARPRDDRFLTSSSSIGSGVAWQPDRRPQSAGGARATHDRSFGATSTALVASAGERSMWQPHRAFSAAGPGS